MRPHPRATIRSQAIWRLAPILAVTCGTFGCSDEHYGLPQVMSFKDGKRGAFSIHLDDSTESQVVNALPQLNARGLVATFFVNPGSQRYAKYRDVWEVQCPAHGHELADHTMAHADTNDYAQADYEIGECARVIRRVYGDRPRLLAYIRPGGVRWGISLDQETEILDKYQAFRAPRTYGYPSASLSDITAPVREAIERPTWNQIGFHGIGGDWLSTDTADFVRLLDYLVAQSDSVWVGTTSAIYKYWQEFMAVESVALSNATAAGFSVEILCNATRVKTYGCPLAELYDQPLTVRVSVPASWTAFTATQGDVTTRHEVIVTDGARYAQFDVRPNVGSAGVRVVAD